MVGGLFWRGVYRRFQKRGLYRMGLRDKDESPL